MLVIALTISLFARGSTKHVGYASLFLVLLILLQLVQPVASSQPQAQPWRREVTIPVVAVASTPKGEKGVMGTLSVTVSYPGKGRMYISVDPLSELDTQAAARTAVLVASSVLGINPFMYDYYFSLESRSVIVGGPSAGAAMTIATLAALRGDSIRRDVAITGMINPDGTIGPVGGLTHKLEAVAESGNFTTFLVPLGQRYVQQEVVEKRQEGSTIIVITKTITVDLVKKGKELGINVFEVADIFQAYKYFTGVDLRYPYMTPKPVVSKYVSEVATWYKELKTLANERMLETKSVLAKSDVSQQVKAYITSLFSQVNVTLDTARELFTEQKIYSASSYAFQAAVLAEYAYYVAAIASFKNDYTLLLKEWETDVNSTINNVRKLLETNKPKTVEEFEKYVATLIRLERAVDALAKYKELLKKGVLIDTGDTWGALHWLAYSKLRVYTSQTWYKLKVEGEISLYQDIIARVARILVNNAESVLAYSSSLYEYLNVRSAYLDEASYYYNKAREAYDKYNYYGCIAYSLNSIVNGIVAIHQGFHTDVELTANATRSILEIHINRLSEENIDPFIPLSYMEFGDIQRDWLEKIYFYELAAGYANILLLLAMSTQTQSWLYNVTSTPSPITNQTTTAPQAGAQQSISKHAISFIAGLLVGILAVLLIQVLRGGETDFDKFVKEWTGEKPSYYSRKPLL